MMFLIKRSEYDDDVVADQKAKVLKMMMLIERSKCWRWSKGQSAEDDVVDQKVKVLKMMLLIKSSKCWRCCCWSKGQICCWSKHSKIVANRSGQSVDVAEDWRLKMKTTWCWKSFQWFIDVLPWWCWWCPLYLSYYCCCWCCCRIPLSLRGSVELL